MDKREMVIVVAEGPDDGVVLAMVCVRLFTRWEGLILATMWVVAVVLRDEWVDEMDWMLDASVEMGDFLS